MTGLIAPRRLTYVRLPDLRPAVRNPKLHVLARIVESMRRFGWTHPVLVCERTQRIAAGHGRVAASVEMKHRALSPPDGVLIDDDGEWLIPVTRGWASRDDLELEAYVILDNKLVEDGGWHNQTLVAMLEEIHAGDAELFDQLAYDHEEMDELFRWAAAENKTGGSEDVDQGGELTDSLTDVDTGQEEPSAVASAGPALVVCPSCQHQFDPATLTVPPA